MEATVQPHVKRGPGSRWCSGGLLEHAGAVAGLPAGIPSRRAISHPRKGLHEKGLSGCLWGSPALGHKAEGMTAGALMPACGMGPAGEPGLTTWPGSLMPQEGWEFKAGLAGVERMALVVALCLLSLRGHGPLRECPYLRVGQVTPSFLPCEGVAQMGITIPHIPRSCRRRHGGNKTSWAQHAAWGPQDAAAQCPRSQPRILQAGRWGTPPL